MKARDFRALARQALSGRWGVAVLTGFLAALLGGTMASSGSSGSGGSSVGSSAGEFIQSSGGHYEIPDFVWTALIIFGTLLSIYALVCFIIGGKDLAHAAGRAGDDGDFFHIERLLSEECFAKSIGNR